MSSKKYTVNDLLKVRYATNPSQDTFFQWEGSIFAFIPGQAPKKIFKCIGMNVSKAKIEDNKLKVSGKELTYYLDPTTGAKLDRWDNPWTEEKNLPVVHIANDPVQMALPTFIPMDVRHNKFSGSAAIVSEIPLFYPNPLAVQDHTFDAFDSNKMYEAGEFFTFKCDAQQLDQPDTIDQVEVNWTRVSKFAPFMKMGGKEGYLVYHCTGYKLPQHATADDLDALLAKEIKDVVPEYATADEYNPDAQNVSSWSYFKQHFDRYQNEPEATWPIPSKE
ncbi:hypothetical protein V8B55DRAFT_1489763 [Mucor lusitanicus]|uniref:DUF1838 domain-containing protein n=2 Tax=Mucor circinelloides f. lusitanicus TaxID=29924 RepID=A0A162TGR5_MUCCL|nr:hypothetical protein FB192DRAFT_1363774 [Mucor lusitanicus]OAD04462.1 hypothetical protein MUCCIDRAFT_108286 [Mucor lusitanicus CBS 277.49]